MLAKGEQAPDLTLVGLDGRSYSLTEARRAGWVFLAFFDLACPTSQLSFLYWDRLHEAYAGEGFTFWTVSVDPPAEVARFVERSGVTFPVLLDRDSRITREFGVLATPTHFLVDQDGTIMESYDGFERAALNRLAAVAAQRLDRPAVELAGEEAPEFQMACSLLLPL